MMERITCRRENSGMTSHFGTRQARVESALFGRLDSRNYYLLSARPLRSVRPNSNGNRDPHCRADAVLMRMENRPQSVFATTRITWVWLVLRDSTGCPQPRNVPRVCRYSCIYHRDAYMYCKSIKLDLSWNASSCIFPSTKASVQLNVEQTRMDPSGYLDIEAFSLGLRASLDYGAGRKRR